MCTLHHCTTTTHHCSMYVRTKAARPGPGRNRTGWMPLLLVHIISNEATKGCPEAGDRWRTQSRSQPPRFLPCCTHAHALCFSALGLVNTHPIIHLLACLLYTAYEMMNE